MKKGLIVVILCLCYVFFHHIVYIITEGSKSATPSKQYVQRSSNDYILSYPKYKWCKVAAFCEETWIWENQTARNLRQEPFHDVVGVCWKLGSFYPRKHRLRVNVRICAQLQSTYIILQLQKNRRKFRSQTSDLWTDAATVVKRVEEKKKIREDRARREKMKARAQSRKTERLSNVLWLRRAEE